jgi:hypothetical protein
VLSCEVEQLRLGTSGRTLFCGGSVCYDPRLRGARTLGPSSASQSEKDSARLTVRQCASMFVSVHTYTLQGSAHSVYEVFIESANVSGLYGQVVPGSIVPSVRHD